MPEPTVPVVFPLTLRLPLSVAESAAGRAEVSQALARVVEDAALYGDEDYSARAQAAARRSLRSLCPEDDGAGSFGLTVGPPAVEVGEWQEAQRQLAADAERVSRLTS